MDEEVISYSGNGTYNITSGDFDYEYERPLFVAIIYTILSIIALVVDVLIIDVIAFTPQLKTTTNLIVLNWTICDFFYLLFEPSKVAIILYHMGVFIYSRFYLVILSIHYLMQCFTLFFVSLLMIDCFYKKLNSETFRRIIPFIWIIFSIIILSVIIAAGYSILFIADIMLFFTFLLLLLVCAVKIVIFACRRVLMKELKGEVRYVLAYSYLTCWFLVAVLHFSAEVGYRYRRDIMIVAQMFVFIGLSYPLIQLMLLCHFDENFRVNFHKLITRLKSFSRNTNTAINI